MPQNSSSDSQLSDAALYALQMSSAGNGFALWHPDNGVDATGAPKLRARPGDYGFVTRHGSWRRLFNLHLEAGNPEQSSTLPQTFQEKDYFPFPGEQLEQYNIVRNSLRSGTEISVGISGGIIGTPLLAGRASYTSSRHKAAFLAWPEGVQRNDVYAGQEYLNRLLAGRDRWLAVARHEDPSLKLEDLILVTGCDLARSWTTAVAYDTSISGQFSFDVDVASVAGSNFAGNIQWYNTRGARYNSGPTRRLLELPSTSARATTSPLSLLSDSTPQPTVYAIIANTHIESDDERDQCLFLRGFRIKERFIVAPKVLRAAAEPQNLPRSDPSKDYELSRIAPEQQSVEYDWETIPDKREVHDHLHEALDYILNNSEVNLAVVHESNFVDEEVQRSSLESGDSPSLSKLLSAEPVVRVADHGGVQVGFISPPARFGPGDIKPFKWDASTRVDTEVAFSDKGPPYTSDTEMDSQYDDEPTSIKTKMLPLALASGSHSTIRHATSHTRGVTQRTLNAVFSHHTNSIMASVAESDKGYEILADRMARLIRSEAPPDAFTDFDDYVEEVYLDAAATINFPDPMLPQNCIAIKQSTHSKYPASEGFLASDGVCRLVLDILLPPEIRRLMFPMPTFIPYEKSKKQQENDLDRTDMLPIFFFNTDGTLGFHLIDERFCDKLRNRTLERKPRTSLKLKFEIRGYGKDEKRLQYKKKSNGSDGPIQIDVHRFARLVRGAVFNFLADAPKNLREENKKRDRPADYLDYPKWRIGTGHGKISARDIMVLGVYFVSPGAAMPILRLRDGFEFAPPYQLEDIGGQTFANLLLAQPSTSAVSYSDVHAQGFDSYANSSSYGGANAITTTSGYHYTQAQNAAHGPSQGFMVPRKA